MSRIPTHVIEERVMQQLHRPMTVKELQQLLSLGTPTIRNALVLLMAEGKVERQGVRYASTAAE